MKNIYNVIVVLSMFFMLQGCDKDNLDRKVTYQITNANAEITIQYRDADGAIVAVEKSFTQREEVWQTTFVMDRGDIVYLSAEYSDSGASVKGRILVNGKVYKEAGSKYDPEVPVTVSGVVP